MLLVLLPRQPLQGQQAAVPETTASQTPAAAPPDEPVPAPTIDPKTGLPISAADQHEKEIDKYDPLKRSVDPTESDTNRLTDREQPKSTATSTATASGSPPLPGSVAASNAASTTSSQTGAQSLAMDASTDGSAAVGEYTGPAVLSRSYTLARPMESQQIKWKLSAGFAFSWDKGQQPVATASGGVYPTMSVESLSPTWGLSGRHLWKHDQLGVVYSGNYSRYTSGSLSGLNNSLNLDLSHVVSRKLTVQFVESVQMMSQNYSLENPSLALGASVANINTAVSPGQQILGSSTRQSNSSVSLTYHPTKRMSYDLSAGYFITGRTGANFTGMTGHQLSTDVNYRLTSKTTIGAVFSYTNYLYSHHVSTSDSFSAGVLYSFALNRRTQLRTRFGATRIESLGYATVPLPPEVAAILGQLSTVINAYSLRTVSDISAELVRDLGRSRTVNISYSRGQSPGNGVLLTSTQESINAGFAARLFRRIPANVGAAYSSLNAISQGNLGFSRSETFTAGISRQLRPGMNSTFSVGYRRYSISGTPLLQQDLRFSVALSWSPPENSLRF